MKDQISALMDDELLLDEHDASHLEYLFTSIKAGGESAESWAIYHLIGDVIRNNPALSSGFQQRVMQQLDKEATVFAPNAQPRHLNHNPTLSANTENSVNTHKSWLKTPGKWSIAASLAAVAFVGWIALQQTSQTNSAEPQLKIALQNEPAEYILAHQSSAPTNAAYYIQPATYSGY